jgi:hypothetical protein
VPANCSVVATKAGWSSSQCAAQQPTCGTLNFKGGDNAMLKAPLYTMEGWQSKFPTPDAFAELKINGNWFDIRGPANYPHVEPCTNIFGYSVSNGVVVSRADSGDPSGGATNYLDALLIAPGADGRNQFYFARNSAISTYTDVKHAIGGFLLVENGKVRKIGEMSSSTKPDKTGARTAIGIDKSGDTMTVVVVQPGPQKTGMTAQQIAYYLKLKHNAYQVINLDNSGSSQFYFKNGSTVYKALPGDTPPVGTTPVYRPVPNFLSIRVPQETASPTYHDEL